jgi:phosphoenolpyruvate carboxylase
VRRSGVVVSEKIASLRTRVSTLPSAEQPAFTADLDAVESALAKADYTNALTAVDLISQRALERDGHGLLDEWRATRDADNQVGELLAGAATLKFSIAYLRDYGQ